MLFIAHDLSVVDYLCDQVAVMYLGRIVESGPAQVVHRAPAHPYTKALLSAVPVPDPHAARKREILAGQIPARSPPSGCVFRTRCPKATQECAAALPPAVALGAGHVAHCIHIEGNGR
ncbi:oligopeptide/dipeptide ABC transporter ATP-binding protein [Paracoccus cavernae]|uniref:oligopeptide/dipeptide ABC transporter ATP-binding protein n=1 Tax=Paracoccus cavernae TaxID=1571207 RepID=UPI003626E64F